MRLQKKYEVIRFVKQGQDCHIVSDYVTGEILAEYLKKQPNISKEQLFLWIHQLVSELMAISSIKDVSNYGYLNPFCIIIKQDNTISLLNLKAESNFEILRSMEKNNILQLFFPKDQYDEIFSFGKTLQFILAKTNISPPLSKMEERKLKHIISKCLSDKFKKKYQNFSEIKSDFPKKVKKKVKKLIYLFWIAVIVLAFGAGEKYREAKASNKYVEYVNEMNEIYMELGQVYFFILEDYAKSKELFSKVEKEVEAECYEQLSSFMAGNKMLPEEEVLQILMTLETGGIGTYVHQGCLLRAYGKLSSEEAKQQIIRIGTNLLKEESEKKMWLSDEMECEIQEMLLTVYLESGNYEKAIECCREVSPETKFSVIKVLCRDSIISNEEKEKYLTSLVNDNLEIIKEEVFIKLQTEYGIQIEGGKVWLEK